MKSKIFLAVLFAIILSGLFCFQTSLPSAQQHQKILTTLQKIDKDAIILNEQILKIHQGLLKNYDNLIATVDRLKSTTTSLNMSQLGLEQRSPSKLDLLQQRLNKLGTSTEYFLSKNAVLNNSLSYLPVLVADFFPRTLEQRLATYSLVQELILYTRTPNFERKLKINTLLEQLSSERLIISPGKTDILSAIIAHSHIINDSTDLVSDELRNIFAYNITGAIASIRQLYLQSYTQKQQQRYYSNWAIYFIAFCLLLLLANFISTIRSATKSLRASNKKLFLEVQQRTKAETKQKAEASFLQTLLDNISDGIVVCDNEGKLVVFNKAAEAIYGQGLKPIQADQWAQQYQLHDRHGKNLLTKQQLPLYRALTEGKIDNEEIVVKFDLASPKTVLINGTQIIQDNKQKSGAVICIRDITEYKQQQQLITRNADEEKVLASILHFSFLPLDDFLQRSIETIVSLPWLKLKPKSGLFLTDTQGNEDTLVLRCSYNLSPELLTLCARVPFGKCLCGKAAQTAEIQFASCINHRHEITYPGIQPHGHYNVPVMDGDKVLGVIVLYLTHGHQQQDYEINFLKRIADVLSLGISRHQAEQHAEHLAYHDVLTGLPNRMLLTDRLEQLIASNKRHSRFSALMYIDLDRFKNINDSLGHSVGDGLLKEVSSRFQQVLRQEDTVARIGGDEFVILLTNKESTKETAVNEAQHIADKLHLAIAEEMTILNHGLYITLSIGIVIVTGAEENTESLMMQADTAMYQAKTNGRNGSQFFMPEMQAIAQVRLELEKDLRHALERKEIHVYYQPQMDVNGQLVGAEALIRWIHPQRGFVSPVEFIPIAEESSIILDMGRYVLEDACKRIKQWNSIESLEHVAVNVSPVQFSQATFVTMVQQVIEQTNIDAKKLTLELTEGILVDNVADVIKKMQQLKQLGVHFSIDDFGTGYSSLAYLTKFPLDQLKIDKSFVDDIGKDLDDQIIIETIIAMADRLGFNLIAEGVETSEQVQFLKDKGCFNYQGYYFSKPLPSSEFSKRYL